MVNNYLIQICLIPNGDKTKGTVPVEDCFACITHAQHLHHAYKQNVVWVFHPILSVLILFISLINNYILLNISTLFLYILENSTQC